ncbi:molybdopterin-dependent oxidoreductase [Patulibacter defluvii]|uniref:molybdopterin-dependent oxidoreductase n=1 Tax=Patulibacter defluvii TaxID=3095358 RepID=UPI002A748E4D|nr:molybdopterin-dependent oxidoreductase [Patulibacter sp. DM4]
MPVRTCPFCEATCGLDVTLDGDRVVKVRGDADDVFSHGFVCPKGTSLQQLHEDPDRVRRPLVKQPDGSFAEVGWDAAFARIAELWAPFVGAADPNEVAVYLGNPAAHGLSAMLYGRVLLKALRTRSIFSASTLDQYPKQLATAHLFGSGATVPVPDLDRTDHLLILGANPVVSNGSLMTAPDVRGRLQAIRARGGKVVVVDPRRTRTAREADQHLAIRPGGDAAWLMALLHVLAAEGLTTPGEHLAGLDEVLAAAEPFTPEAVAAVTGIAPEVTRTAARELAAAPRACVYGRIGTTTQRFGATASWLVDVLNAVTGNLDRPGGAMFPLPAHGKRGAGRGRGARFGRWTSRVRGVGEVFGELPAACLAEELETPGPGQVRALITIAGNPVLSAPGGGRLAEALPGLDAYVALDIYVNETTRHADVILPAPSPLEKAHYDLALYGFAIRNVANYSPPLLARDGLDEWQSLLRLVGVVTGQGPDADVAAIDAFVARGLAEREVGDERSALHGRDLDGLLAELEPRVGPERLLDLLLRGGAYGLTLADLEAAPHGIDLGPLEPRLPEVLATPSGRVELAPAALLEDVERLALALDEPADGMLLIGRRDLRSNNSWMHNLPLLVSGPARCTAWIHPDDAARVGVADGEPLRISSRVGAIELPATVTDRIRPGVVSVPHGWGHDAAGARMEVARGVAGVNANRLADGETLEPLSGTAVLNGIPVEVAVPVPAPA